jgi:hypothetical protein
MCDYITLDCSNKAITVNTGAARTIIPLQIEKKQYDVKLCAGTSMTTLNLE